MPSIMVAFRCPPDLHAAIVRESKASGTQVGQVIRETLGEGLGVAVADRLAVGLAGADDATRQRVHEGGLAARRVKMRGKMDKTKKSGRKSKKVGSRKS